MIDIILKKSDTESIKCKIQVISNSELDQITNFQNKIHERMQFLGEAHRIIPIPYQTMQNFLSSANSICIGVFSDNQLLGLRIFNITNLNSNSDQIINQYFQLIDPNVVGNLQENAGIFRLSLIDESLRGYGLQYLNSLISLDQAFSDPYKYGQLGHLITLTDPSNFYSTQNLQKLGLKIVTEPIQYGDFTRQCLYTQIDEGYKRNNFEILQHLLETRYRQDIDL